jgi:hypothetical protein
VAAIDDEAHGRQRKNFSNAFRVRAVEEQEGLVKGYVVLLVRRSSERCLGATGRQWIWLLGNYTTFDISGYETQILISLPTSLSIPSIKPTTN